MLLLKTEFIYENTSVVIYVHISVVVYCLSQNLTIISFIRHYSFGQNIDFSGQCILTRFRFLILGQC